MYALLNYKLMFVTIIVIFVQNVYTSSSYIQLQHTDWDFYADRECADTIKATS